MNDSTKTVEKKKMKAPNPMLIIACIIIVGAIASYFVPAGVYERIADPNTGREVVDPASFHFVDSNPTTIFDLFMSIPLGIQKSSSIIAFLFVIGGAFGILDATGALRSSMGALVRKMRGRELMLIPTVMLVFSLGATFVGNNEEFLPFLPLILSICFALGFDSLTALGILFCSVAAGYGAGITQPFSVGVAQGIAGLPLFSGMPLRIALFCVLYVINVCFVLYHARKVKKNPESSPMYELDRKRENSIVLDEGAPITNRHIAILVVFLATIVGVVYGVLKKGFYIDEIAALFLMMGIAAGVIGGLGVDGIADNFIKGCKDLLFPAFMVGMCRAITLILTDASIMDTIIYALASLLNKIPPAFNAFGMFMIQDVFNLLVPSSSGQAAITMPILAPLADLVGLTRQTAVLAFQMGDAFTNCVTPASGMTMACLATAGVPINKWWRFILPLMAIWWVVAFAFLSYTTATGYGPF